jgi:hypothetical protein
MKPASSQRPSTTNKLQFDEDPLLLVADEVKKTSTHHQHHNNNNEDDPLLIVSNPTTSSSTTLLSSEIDPLSSSSTTTNKPQSSNPTQTQTQTNRLSSFLDHLIITEPQSQRSTTTTSPSSTLQQQQQQRTRLRQLKKLPDQDDYSNTTIESFIHRKTAQCEVYWHRNDKMSSMLILADLIEDILSSKSLIKITSSTTSNISIIHCWIQITTTLNRFATRLLSSVTNTNTNWSLTNWRHRTSRIDRLIPRLYLQAALNTESLLDIARQTQGISNPISCLLLRAYLCTLAVSMRIDSSLDVIAMLWHLPLPSNSTLINDTPLIQARSIIYLCYCTIQPSIEVEIFLSALSSIPPPPTTNDDDNITSILTTPTSILQVVSDEIICDHALPVAEFLTHHHPHTLNLIQSFAECLLRCPPSREMGIQVMTHIFDFFPITTTTNNNETDNDLPIIQFTSIFVELASQNYGEREVLKLINNMEKRIRASNHPRHVFSTSLFRACNSVVQRGLREHGFPKGKLLRSESFAGLFSILAEKDKAHLAVLLLEKGVLGNYSILSSTEETTEFDPIETYAILFIAKSLHDVTPNVYIFKEGKLFIDHLLKRIIDLILHYNININNMNNDCLTLLQYCRASFYNSQSVLKSICLFAMKVAINIQQQTITTTATTATRRRRFFQSHSITSLILSCLGFFHATVPSMDDRLTRGRLFIYGGIMASSFGSPTFVDIFYRNAIETLASCEDSRCFQLLVPQLCSSLVVIGGPNGSPLFWFRALVNAIRIAPCSGEKQLIKESLSNLLRVLSFHNTNSLPYHTWRGNDELFGDVYHEEFFVKEVEMARIKLRDLV